MCGIFGVIDLVQPVDIKTDGFKEALMKMIHRGPDNQSVLRVNEHCLLGHVRLSIIDLEAQSNQPFVDPNQRYHLVYNGEIFNYVELREELKALGCTFRTESDTEVLLQAYIVWGEECVQRFNGMWAFVIYDAMNNSVFCSRDRFGIKPFYYAKVGTGIVFASEIKSIIHLFPDFIKPNYLNIENFCRCSVGAQLNETWFEDIFRLPVAHNLTLSDKGVDITRYWDFPKEEKLSNASDERVIEDYRCLFQDSLDIRYRSDVPVGVAMSAGLDSNSILHSTKKEQLPVITSYSVGANVNLYDEHENAWLSNPAQIKDEAEVARVSAQIAGIGFEKIDLDLTHYAKHLQQTIYHLECGHQSVPIVAYDQLMRRVSQSTTVLMEGQGADELMGGYVTTSVTHYCVELVTKFKIIRAIKEFRSHISTYSLVQSLKCLVGSWGLYRIRGWYTQIVGIDALYLGPLRSKKVLKLNVKRRRGEGYLNFKLREQHIGTLVNLLHYGDAISMAHSVESRVPFMDYRLVEFVFKLPSRFKVREGMGKVIHRDAMKGIVPNFILEDKVKMGFNIPLMKIFLEEGPESPRGILLSERTLNRGLFCGKTLAKELDRLKDDAGLLPMLYRMLSVELWFRLFIDGDEINGLTVR
jgi:asparagine synthase (glutamine-hydrolysing)